MPRSPIKQDEFSVGDRVVHYRDLSWKGTVKSVAENGLSCQVLWDEDGDKSDNENPDDWDFQWQGKLQHLKEDE